LLLGRHSEREALDRLLAAVRGGGAGCWWCAGEPGAGKTALLDYAMEAATGFLIARAVGVEWEMELPVAALQRSPPGSATTSWLPPSPES
jgi:hypothetical protein